MNVEVDQSGKIGKTNEDTVLAFANGISFAVLIPRLVKQQCLRTLRQRGLSAESIYLRMFVIGLHFLLRGHMVRIEQVIIDTEYPGKDKEIKERLYNLLHRDGVKVDRRKLAFGFIGKKSNAHVVAITTYRGERQANIVLTVEDILGEF